MSTVRGTGSITQGTGHAPAVGAAPALDHSLLVGVGSLGLLLVVLALIVPLLGAT
ncbi:MAG TPA: hypothetical protein VMS86_08885 [Thermoanaerobaculia bacterium]|nr:hypothetical protein [Thermoanaerobaculia bacterium]